MLKPLRTLILGAIVAFVGTTAVAQVAGDEPPINVVDGERLAAIAQANMVEMETGYLAPGHGGYTDVKGSGKTAIAEHSKVQATLRKDVSASRASSVVAVELETAGEPPLERASKISATPN